MLTRKKAGFLCSVLETGSTFISQDEGMSESHVKTLETLLGPHYICSGGLSSLRHLERHAEFNTSKGNDAWPFLKIDRNPNITVAIGKGSWFSCLTLIRIPIALPSLEEIPEVSLITRQES